MQLSSCLLVLTLIGFLFSCKKDDNNVPLPSEKAIKLVKQLVASTTDFINYEYDSSGQVTKYITQWQNVGGTVSRLTNVYKYAGKKLVKSSNESGYGTYTYAGDLISRSEHFAANGKKISSLTYSFNAAGQLTEVTEQIANPFDDAPMATRISYQYYANGNLSRLDFAHRKETTGSFIINFSKVFVEYDNKPNPEPDGVIGNFLPGVILLINNPVRINNLSADGSPMGYSRYEYSYNEKGLPTRRKQFIAVGDLEQSPISFQYVY
ncbi:MAG: hypothetical protein JWQ40_427 [Segetibacter sp.]|nr:hypothetical protein [Segetibacter sp.]